MIIMDNIVYECGCEIEWTDAYKAWIIIKFCEYHNNKGEYWIKENTLTEIIYKK